ncbi:alkene reductase [Agrobacterium salinitolerans]|jgi:N-ethylmaleimide reductase|uniref:Alkene reductase n=1 Tax=Agrobacterium salinitolerans TaxID=1183413 RepID=A0A1S9EX26_9HYPH|nr:MULTISPECIES: alkene reductase [Agrobacterium]PNQ24011.1 alkene reductase [Rhizobium sp. YIC5082]MCZ7851356.1 alkene reductase [Agrobacterium salinitolerans]MCZ7856899.1 alkene reductase [Agrobacterium salinitolerans]MCZ7863049.1 alkene reductase [Agrobacterium salinitolerans]MCZ7886092.1 alkene reductase [Agrobacterium salinitolerans]
MTSLFEPAQAGDIVLANRIVMAPLTRNRSPGAIPNNLNATYYEQRATAGLIVTEGTPISQQGQGYADVPGLYKREAIDGWKKITDGVHSAGGKIVAQIWHVGRISHVSLQPHGGQPVAPSAIPAKSKTYIINDDGTGAFAETSEPRALTIDDIGLILEDYRSGARAALEAGFDGVEIHAANGYLIEQFLKSSTNQRTDDYGGSIENRARFLLEVVDAVAEEIGAGRTGIRLSPVTPANDIFEADPQPLYNYVVEQLGKRNLAFIHVVEGATGGPRDFKQGDKPFDYAAFKAAYRNAGGKGLWIANNGYDRESAIQAVESGKVDAVAFGKAFIANPDLVRRFKDNAPLNEPNQPTFYGGGAEGYTDYPALA